MDNEIACIDPATTEAFDIDLVKLCAQVNELHEILMQIKPVLENPGILLEGLPVGIRQMLGL